MKRCEPTFSRSFYLATSGPEWKVAVAATAGTGGQIRPDSGYWLMVMS